MKNMPFGNVYYGKKVLITGNTGFKGSWLTIWLEYLGAEIVGISKDIPTTPSMYDELGLANKIDNNFCDIRDFERMIEVINESKPDFVFHLAAQAIVSTSYREPGDTITTNVIGTLNILEALRQLNIKCTAIIITSDKCYDNVEWVWGYKETDSLGGKDIYSGSKGAAELVFKSYFHSFFNNADSKVKVAVARAGNVIGGGDWAADRIVPDCMRAWSKGEIVEIRSPNATRPWQHVLEPLSGYLNLGSELFSDDSLNGQSFNFGPHAEHTSTVKKLLEDLSGCWKYDNPTNAYCITDDIKFYEAGLLKLNCDKALFHLKWIPTLNYNQLLNFTGDWYYNFYNSKLDMHEYTMNQIIEYVKIAKEKNIKWAI